MAFGTATVVTASGKTTAANRLQTTPTRNPPKYIGIGVGATGAARTAVAADTALTTEVETRALGTETIVGGALDTYQTVGTQTATAARAVDEGATFDAASTGNMGVSATFAVVNLANGDSLQNTFKWQFI